ncbi:MAG: S-adenosylmethionine:tRNA ribosyltransferase-isomerase [Muribaculaceae bacterium]|nr:S-adenosylmethionine:tRNA ribosyltransferase-isomerase [Muribaculaceae bacterium]
MVKEIKIEEFDYSLPEGRIPVHPLEKRDECRLLVRSPQGRIYHRKFVNLADLLPPASLLVCNDTKVINARLQFHKDSGAAIELFLLEPVDPSDYALNFQSKKECVWKCLVGNSKKWKEGKIYLNLNVDESSTLMIAAERVRLLDDGASEVRFSWDNIDFTFGRIIEMAGKIPIPPYLNRESEDSDREDYQTVYARVNGSVAAPTAGLHFTPQVFESLEAHGDSVAKVTLHVGAGTFRPVKSDTIGDHAMHSEPFSVTNQLIRQLIEWKTAGKPIIAVGTTSVRTLESLPYIGIALGRGEENPFIVNQWDPYGDKTNDFDTVRSLQYILEWMDKNKVDTLRASTSIMIAPGFKWRIVDGMVTNFHQPKSTLLLLVSSFLGGDSWRPLYEEALSNSYRFLSYGDASLLLH